MVLILPHGSADIYNKLDLWPSRSAPTKYIDRGGMNENYVFTNMSAR
jgi:hypothetical protein